MLPLKRGLCLAATSFEYDEYDDSFDFLFVVVFGDNDETTTKRFDEEAAAPAAAAGEDGNAREPKSDLDDDTDSPQSGALKAPARELATVGTENIPGGGPV